MILIYPLNGFDLICGFISGSIVYGMACSFKENKALISFIIQKIAYSVKLNVLFTVILSSFSEAP